MPAERGYGMCLNDVLQYRVAYRLRLMEKLRNPRRLAKMSKRLVVWIMVADGSMDNLSAFARPNCRA